MSAILPGMDALVPLLKQIEQSKSTRRRGKYHFTTYNQIEALAGIGEDPNTDIGFMAPGPDSGR